MTVEQHKVPRVVFVDLDQTLLKGDEQWMGESWLLLANFLGIDTTKHMKIYLSYREKGGNSDDSLEQMIEDVIRLWQDSYQESHNGQSITRKTIEEACLKLAKKYLNKEAKLVMDQFIEEGIIPIVGTGGLAIMAQQAAQTIGTATAIQALNMSSIPSFFGNSEFVYDEAGILIGFTHQPDIVLQKKQQVEEIIEDIEQQLGKSLAVMAIGDGSSDLGVFEAVPGVTIGTENEKLTNTAVASAESWPEVAEYIFFFLEQINEAIVKE